MKFLLLLLLPVMSFAGNVDTVSIYSASMHKEIKCVVITPDSYKRGSNRYPVVYLLHGYSGNYAQWIKLAPQLKTRVDELQAILVCPDGGFSSWYWDSPKDSTVRYETFVSNELVNYVDFRYRTIADRSSRSITGLSMGGHGGLYLGIRHQDVFGSAGSISGGVDIRMFPNGWEMKKNLGDTACCRENWETHTVMNVVDALRNGSIRIVFDCGVDDFFIGVNRALHEKLLKMKIDHDYTERPGAHANPYWKNSIDYQLIFLLGKAGGTIKN